MKLLSKRFLLSTAVALSISTFATAEEKSAAATVEYFKLKFQEGDLGKVWSLLPKSYQTDINTLSHDFAKNVDKDVYNKITSVLGKLNNALTEKKDVYAETIYSFAQNNPTGPKSQAEVAKGIEGLTNTLTALLSSDLASVEKLEKIDMGQFMQETASPLLKKLQDALATSGNDDVAFLKATMDSLKIDVLSAAEDTTKLKLTVTDAKTQKEDPKEVAFTKVEGKWVPSDMAKDWAKGVADAKAGIESMSSPQAQQNKMQTMMMLSMIEGMADQMGVVNSKEDVMALIQNSPLGAMMMPKAPQPPAVEINTPTVPEVKVKTPAIPAL